MIAVVIPAFKVKDKILQVVNELGDNISKIIVVDDCCPEGSGVYLNENYKDIRLEIIYHKKNQGVGGAMITGYKRAKALKAEIIIKLDGDGQMDAHYIPTLVEPILNGKADYTKGNRFHSIEFVKNMPALRLFGNSALSLINKIVTGYWSIMDPTNGFTVISKDTLDKLDLDKLSKRYFFESDILFRLSIQRSVVVDVSIPAKYEDENSSLNITRVFFSFPLKYIKRYFKRVFYIYFLRDFNAGTIQLTFGLLLFLFGMIFGLLEWMKSINSSIPATSGTIMLASLPLILGFQLLLGFIYFEINSQPRK